MLVTRTNEIISMNDIMSIEKGEKREEKKTTPNIRVKFVRFDPIAFALARITLRRFTAVRLRLNSGKDVPIATSLAPMKIGGIPRKSAMTKAEDTVNLAEMTIMIVPARILRRVEYLLFALLVWSSVVMGNALFWAFVSL
jgi:hypothetical protein